MQLRSSLKGKHYILITKLILKIKLGFLKDYLGLNPTLKNNN